MVPDTVLLKRVQDTTIFQGIPDSIQTIQKMVKLNFSNMNYIIVQQFTNRVSLEAKAQHSDNDVFFIQLYFNCSFSHKKEERKKEREKVSH